MNFQQREFRNYAIGRLRDGNGGFIYLNGGAGTGRTFSTNGVVSRARAMSKIVLCVITTGIAAMNYPDERTAHNAFRIPVKEDPRDMEKLECDVPPSSEPAHFLRRVVLIIWDEFANSHKMNSHAVDTMLKKIRHRTHLPRGGILLIKCRDFRQILPVIQNGTKTEILQATIEKIRPLEIV